MAGLWSSIKQASCSVWRHLAVTTMSPVPSSGRILNRCHALMASQPSHQYATYKPYTEIEETESPYKKRQPYRYGHKYKYFKGGLLPRPEGKYEDIPVNSMPQFTPQKMDRWTEKRALFGQNDYIDILGDGNVHPVQLIEGPKYLIGFKGNEMQRLLRKLQFQGAYLRENSPKKYHDITKQIWYWYKQYNKKRRHAPFYGKGRKRNRIHDIDNTPR